MFIRFNQNLRLGVLTNYVIIKDKECIGLYLLRHFFAVFRILGLFMGSLHKKLDKFGMHQ